MFSWGRYCNQFFSKTATTLCVVMLDSISMKKQCVESEIRGLLFLCRCEVFDSCKNHAKCRCILSNRSVQCVLH